MAKNEKGFVLPMSMMLMILLSVSGISYMQLDYLEQRMVMEENAHHDAFYLANAGLERSREAFKIIEVNDKPTWEPILDPTHFAHDPRYPTDTNPDPLLCPDINRGCVIPPFQSYAGNPTVIGQDGDPVIYPDIPFSSEFDRGQYQVRAFNNDSETGTVDTDGIIVFRAMGTEREQHKILELTVAATSGLKLINCQNTNPDALCPDKQNANMTIQHLPGREPASTPVLPVWNPNYYRDINNLPCSVAVSMIGHMNIIPGVPNAPDEVQIVDGTCYFATGGITVNNVGPSYSNIAIFADGNLLVSGAADFTQTILISGTGVQLQGNITTRAAMPLPAVISGGDVVKGDASVQVFGNIVAEGNIGSEQHPWNPNEVHGVIIGQDVFLKAAATTVTDDDNPAYYGLMPGFTYPDELKTTVAISGSWKEIL